MGIKRNELVTLKRRIKAEMQRRNGLGPSNRFWMPSQPFGSMTEFADSRYDFLHTPMRDAKIYSEYGEKTVDLLLKIRNYNDLQPTQEGVPIPTGFNSGLLQKARNLSSEGFTGETVVTAAARRAAGEMSVPVVESSSCAGACSGLCVGSCIGMSNGCLNTCTAACGTSCAGGVMVSAKAMT